MFSRQPHLQVLLGFSIALIAASPALGQITPSGLGTVVNSQGNQINISGGTQAGANLFHGFRDFNLNSSQIANFLSNPQTQNILARINGGNPSVINGLLQVTGGNSNLFLMNPSGIVFGQGARLNVPASFTATTANQIGFGNNLFNAFGDNNFSALIGNPDSFLFTTTQAGSIVNAGNLAVGNGQNLTLIAGNTINTGRLTAPGGEIQVLAVPGTNRVRLSQPGQVLSLEIVPPVDGSLKAVDLPALLTGSDLPGIVVNPAGQVQVAGTSLPNQQGVAVASGRIDVSSSTSNGGVVQVLGDRVAILNSRINANGATGGGTVRLGGEYLGGRDTGIAPSMRFNAQRTVVDRDSLIRANATVTGEGGRVIVWADRNTSYFGRITGRGATEQGGFVEVSGKENLAFDGQVELQGFNGLDGSLLLDPINITIVSPGPGGDDAQIGPLDGLISSGDSPANMFISATALSNIAAGTTINITAANNIDFQANVNLTGSTTPAPVFLRAATITSGTFTLNTNGRPLTITADNINAPKLAIQTWNNSFPASGNINITANLGNLNLSTIQTGNSIISSNTGTINLIASQGNITTGAISATTLRGDAGATIITAPQGSITTGSINANSLTGNGGNISLSSRSNIIVGALTTAISNNGNAGSINLNSSQGGVTSSDLTTSTSAGNAGSIYVNALGNIVTGNNSGFALNGNAATISLLSSQGDITSGDNYSGTFSGNGADSTFNAPNGNIMLNSIVAHGTFSGNSSGNILLNAGHLVRVLNGSSFCAGGASICNAGLNGARSGTININYNSGLNTPFIVGDPATNGTFGSINAGLGNIVASPLPITFALSPFIRSRLNITNTFIIPSPNPPSSSTTPPSTTSSLILTLLSNSAPPPTPAPVIVGTPPAPDSTVIPPVSIPISSSISSQPVISSSNLSSGTIANAPVIPPISSPLPSPQPSSNPISIPISNLNSATNFAAQSFIPRDNITQNSRSTLASTSTNFSIFSNSANEEISARLGALENYFQVEFEQYLGINSPISNQINSQYNLSEVILKLNQITEKTKVRPALVYVFFVPPNGTNDFTTNLAAQTNRVARDSDVLEIILITGKRQPVRIQFPHTTRRQVLTVAEDFRSEVTNFRSSRGYLSSAQRMYQWILGGLEEELQAQGINNLVFLMDAGLRSIPLAAMHDGKGFIVERYSVSLMPSLNLTQPSYNPLQGSQVLAMGATIFGNSGLNPLPAVSLELNTVSQLWQGSEFLNDRFTLNNLIQQRQERPFRMIHLATHAVFNPGDRSNSYIQLWDQPLRLDQLNQLNWGNPPVDLLVLSACQTALGDKDAELGFAGLAINSGVRTALASLWEVNDVATLGLMTKFYQQLQVSPTKAEALRQAQLAMIRGEVRLEGGNLVTPEGLVPLTEELRSLENLRLSHPYYWSAFTLVGNPW